MKLSVHTVSYGGGWGGPRLSLEEIIPRVAKLGYDGIEIMGKRPHLSPLDMDRKKIEKIKELLALNNLEVSCIAGYNDFSYSDTYIRFKEKELIYLQQLLRLANEFGAKMVRILSGHLYPTTSYAQQWRWCREYLKEAASLSEKYGIELGLQNHPAIAGSHEEVLQMIREVGSDNVKVILDQAYVNWCREDISKAVRETGKLIVHSHIFDYKMKSPLIEHTIGGGIRRTDRIEVVPVGEGEVDFDVFVGLLREIGYEGFLSYEICSAVYKDHELVTKIEDLEEFLKKGLEHMRKVLGRTSSP